MKCVKRVNKKVYRHMFLCNHCTFTTLLSTFKKIIMYDIFSLSLSGLYAGIKFFIIDFLFKSCPKLRDKYDTPHIDWNNLPTDPQLKERTNATMSRRVRTRTYECVHRRTCTYPHACATYTVYNNTRCHLTKFTVI